MSNSLNGDDPLEGSSSSLEDALLESLFYNEMALMEDFSESFLSAGGLMLSVPTSLSSSADNSEAGSSITTNLHAAPLVTSSDPIVAVEKDLLRDFGVSHSSIAAPPPAPASVNYQHHHHHQRVGAAAAARVPSNNKLPLFVPPPIDVQQQQRNLQLAAVGRGIRHNVAVPPAPPAAAAEEEKRKKLVAQFATLASRLGITLPPQVLEKLTNKATETANSGTTAGVPSVPVAVGHAPAVATVVPSSGASGAAPILQQLQSTAAEAIAAVGKRSAAAAAVDTDKPYSKRRKKPRLSDCERKLAELQAENALLKSHLDNISNKNFKLDQERVKAETQMRAMLQEDAPDAQLDPVVQNFTEMYSDYGRKRHEELNFHLEQLQRCVHSSFRLM